ncbi:MAG: hypothetical protein LUD39_04750 [Opitutae bacterium]|nr:hypothetical protein [Opitutae bacterium]
MKKRFINQSINFRFSLCLTCVFIPANRQRNFKSPAKNTVVSAISRKNFYVARKSAWLLANFAKIVLGAGKKRAIFEAKAKKSWRKDCRRVAQEKRTRRFRYSQKELMAFPDFHKKFDFDREKILVYRPRNISTHTN